MSDMPVGSAVCLSWRPQTPSRRAHGRGQLELDARGSYRRIRSNDIPSDISTTRLDAEVLLSSASRHHSRLQSASGRCQYEPCELRRLVPRGKFAHPMLPLCEAYWGFADREVVMSRQI